MVGETRDDRYNNRQNNAQIVFKLSFSMVMGCFPVLTTYPFGYANHIKMSV